MACAQKAIDKAGQKPLKDIMALPRPMLDFWITPDKDLVSLTKKMITRATAEAELAESKGDAKRAQLLRMAVGFSSKKLQSVTGGTVSGTDVGAELRQTLNVLLNTIYV